MYIHCFIRRITSTQLYRIYIHVFAILNIINIKQVSFNPVQVLWYLYIEKSWYWAILILYSYWAMWYWYSFWFSLQFLCIINAFTKYDIRIILIQLCNFTQMLHYNNIIKLHPFFFLSQINRSFQSLLSLNWHREDVVVRKSPFQVWLCKLSHTCYHLYHKIQCLKDKMSKLEVRVSKFKRQKSREDYWEIKVLQDNDIKCLRVRGAQFRPDTWLRSNLIRWNAGRSLINSVPRLIPWSNSWLDGHTFTDTCTRPIRRLTYPKEMID